MTGDKPGQDDPTIAWLLAGDPAIRWQTMRDLLDAPAKIWQTERKQTLTEGWGARLLARQDPDGRWGAGIYSPKWISTTYTLLLLRDIGIPPDCAAAQRGARLALDGLLGEERDDDFAQQLVALDRCIVGMLLALSVYFRIADDRTDAIVDNLLDELMPDGAWNCRRHTRARPSHSSFHTTLNALDGLREYLDSGSTRAAAKVRQAEKSALELLLAHRLFRSDKTGEIIRPEFAQGSFPHRWHYDYMRALAYFARANAPRDERLIEAIALLESRRDRDGRWSAGKQYSGRTFFKMEPPGPSRWNTLRALRILRWWNAAKTDRRHRRQTQRGDTWNISSTS